MAQFVGSSGREGWGEDKRDGAREVGQPYDQKCRRSSAISQGHHRGEEECNIFKKKRNIQNFFGKIWGKKELGQTIGSVTRRYRSCKNISQWNEDPEKGEDAIPKQRESVWEKAAKKHKTATGGMCGEFHRKFIWVCWKKWEENWWNVLRNAEQWVRRPQHGCWQEMTPLGATEKQKNNHVGNVVGDGKILLLCRRKRSCINRVCAWPGQNLLTSQFARRLFWATNFIWNEWFCVFGAGRDDYSVNGVRRNRSRPSRPYSKDPSGAACLYALCCMTRWAKWWNFRLRRWEGFLWMTARLFWKDKSRTECEAGKFLKTMKSEVEVKGLKLSIIGGRIEGKIKVIVSNEFWEKISRMHEESRSWVARKWKKKKYMWFEVFAHQDQKQVIKKSDMVMRARRLLRMEYSARLIAHIHHSFFFDIAMSSRNSLLQVVAISRCVSFLLQTQRTNHRRLQEYCVHAEVTRLRKFRGFTKWKQPSRTTVPMQIMNSIR